VWKDLLAEGLSCGLHRIERLMRLQALKARPRRHRLPPDLGERQATAVAPNVLDRAVRLMHEDGELGDAFANLHVKVARRLWQSQLGVDHPSKHWCDPAA
jgi:transposase InsO family protein